MQAKEGAIEDQHGQIPEPVVPASPQPQAVRSASLLILALLAAVFTL